MELLKTILLFSRVHTGPVVLSLRGKSMSQPVHKGEVGVTIHLELGLDIAALKPTKVSFKVQKPTQVPTICEWPAEVVMNTRLEHKACVGDLDVPGMYSIQAYVEYPDGVLRGETVMMEVLDDFQ